MAALLAWWRDAGVDACVSDASRRWLDVPPPRALDRARVPAVEPPAVAAGVRRQAAAAPAAADEPDWAAFATADALWAALRAGWPGAPIIDGDPRSGIVVVGEGPSADDLRTGRPFAGPAGLLLDRMLAAIGLDRGSTAITLLAVRQRVPGASAEALARDRALAAAHLRLLAPRRLLLLGRIPTAELAGEDAPVGELRGRWRMSPVVGVPALSTFNPAYLLRRPEAKAEAWADLQLFARGPQ